MSLAAEHREAGAFALRAHFHDACALRVVGIMRTTETALHAFNLGCTPTVIRTLVSCFCALLCVGWAIYSVL